MYAIMHCVIFGSNNDVSLLQHFVLKLVVDVIPWHDYQFYCFILSRIHIMQNIGIVFVKMGQYNDAITSFEHIMGEEPDPRTGLNLILCYYAMLDREKMKRAFQKLLTVDLKLDDDDKYIASNVSERSILMM